MKTAYHIILFDEKNQAKEYPYRDCQHEVWLNARSTYANLIDCIIETLRKHEQYEDVRNAIKQNKNTNKMIIKFGKQAQKNTDLQKKTLIRNHQIVGINDIVEVASNQCIYLIAGIKNKNKPLTLTKSKGKRRRTRTRTPTRTQTLNEHEQKCEFVRKPSPKRRKKVIQNKRAISPSNELESECLWILTEASPSFKGEYETSPKRDTKRRVNKVNAVRECIESITTNNWINEDCPTHLISLYSFGRYLKEESQPLTHSADNAQYILDCFDSIKLCDANAMLWLEAVEKLIGIIQRKQNGMQCDKHRIVLFCGKHGVSTVRGLYALKSNSVKTKLEELDITFDCIQVSHSFRPNGDLYKLANRYWTSILRSAVLCHDFVYPHKRNMNTKQEAIVID